MTLPLTIVLLLMALPLRGSSAAPQEPEFLWQTFEPRAVAAGASGDLVLSTAMDGTPSSVVLSLRGGGSIPLTMQRDGRWTATVPVATALSGYATGDLHNFVGFLEAYEGSERVERFNVFVNVVDDTVPAATIRPLAADAQMSDHVVNIRWDDLFSYPTKDVMGRFYEMFGDSYDFAAIISQVDHARNRSYFEVRNDTGGIGLARRDRGAEWGSPAELEGIIDYPISGYFDLGETTASHEIGHRWMQFLDNRELSDGAPHWPIGDLARGVMGFSLSNGAGGDFPYEFVREGDHYRMQSKPLDGLFSDLELYLMGLASPDEVGEHFVFEDQNQEWCDGCIWTGPVHRISIDDVIAVNGARVPSFESSQKTWRMISLVLSQGRLLDQTEMDFFEHMAARGEAQTPLRFTSGFTSGTTQPFHVATGGRGRLRTTVCPTTVKVPLEVDPCLPTATITGAETVEGHLGDTFVEAVVSLSWEPPSAATVEVATADGTAISAGLADYASTAGTLTWDAGESVLTRSIRIPIHGDLLPEPDEFFTVLMTSSAGVKIGSGRSAAVTIRDDDLR